MTKDTVPNDDPLVDLRKKIASLPRQSIFDFTVDQMHALLETAHAYWDIGEVGCSKGDFAQDIEDLELFVELRERLELLILDEPFDGGIDELSDSMQPWDLNRFPNSSVMPEPRAWTTRQFV